MLWNEEIREVPLMKLAVNMCIKSIISSLKYELGRGE
jgi:hypothetical protein